LLPADLAIEKVVDQRDHLVRLILEREMARVDEVELGVWRIARIWVRAACREDGIVGAPDDNCGWLTLAEEGLNLGESSTLWR
jgi:hypothetical protein